eukprot:GDKI01028967.1.p1 GENE.GDKI01028967.1~~GDKI01028967.1.p1  ORF type:complete len:205 (-),score=74.26 GDKI01028967.1:577-1191(-)
MAGAPVGGTNKFKFIFVGEQAVGKTAIITRFVYDTFDDNYQATIGMDLLSKTIHINEKPVRLQLWDTAGQERFRALIPSYFRDASAAIVVYDVCNRGSFQKADYWIEEVRKERGTDILIALVGNKADMADKRQVPTDEAENKAQMMQCMFFETSARTGANIKESFRSMAASLLNAGVSGKGPGGDIAQLTPEPSPAVEAKGCGC